MYAAAYTGDRGAVETAARVCQTFNSGTGSSANNGTAPHVKATLINTADRLLVACSFGKRPRGSSARRRRAPTLSIVIGSLLESVSPTRNHREELPNRTLLHLGTRQCFLVASRS